MPVKSEVNPILKIERQKASFDVNEFAAWYHDGEANLKRKRLIDDELFADFNDYMSHEYLSYEDMCNISVQHSIRAVEKMKQLQQKINPGGDDFYPNLMYDYQSSALMPTGNPFAVHFLMFIKALKNQGTSEQYEKWGKRADSCEILGTYCQTELGHGTFLRGLETTAHYDRASDEFILNTPHLTSYKWWPGGLASTSNYCIVVAQLFIDNQPKGVQLFFLQIRDEKSHAVMPGIDLGEIGKKIGFYGVNNGYLGLKNVRIPRTNMLMKNAQVHRDGTFVQNSSQLAYFPMVFVRCFVAFNNSMILAQAATISTRYSAVRKQGTINPDQPEVAVIDYLTQQMKIFPEIANAIVYNISAKHLWKMYYETAEAINKQDYSRLPELHALACILKVACSYDSSSGVEKLRQATGGHGYLKAANLGNMFATATAACTYEGENSVLYLQVGKILMKSWQKVLKGKSLQLPTLAYLSECSGLQKFPKWTGSWECMVKALEYAATNKTQNAFKKFSHCLQSGQSNEQAVNSTGLLLTQAAELHGRVFTASSFLKEVTGSSAAQRSAALNRVLENLLELYLLNTLMRHLQDLLRFINLTEADIIKLQERLEQVLAKIRPDAVAIVDGFDFHDAVLKSVLGSYDGNVYERIFESAKNSPMNKSEIPKMFELHLKPFMKSNM